MNRGDSDSLPAPPMRRSADPVPGAGIACGKAEDS